MVLENKDKEGGRKAVSLFVPGLSGQEEGLFFFALFVLSLLFSPFFFSLFFSLSLSLSLKAATTNKRANYTKRG
jgi:hypothetical protein